MNIKAGALEHFIYDRIAHNRVLQLTSEELEILRAPTTSSMMAYLGQNVVFVSDSIYSALAEVTRQTWVNPIQQTCSMNIDPANFQDTETGRAAMLRAMTAASPKTINLVVPAGLVDATLLDMAEHGQHDLRLLII